MDEVVTPQQFFNNNRGKVLDNGWGNFSGECVSLAIRYAYEVHGVPYGTLFCSASGGARDLYEQFDGTIPDYYEQVSKYTTPPYGALAVFGVELGKYGHVGVVISTDVDAGTITVYDQYVGKEAGETTWHISAVIGFLKRKVEVQVDDKIKPEHLDILRGWQSEVVGSDAKAIHVDHVMDQVLLSTHVDQPWWSVARGLFSSPPADQYRKAKVEAFAALAASQVDKSVIAELNKSLKASNDENAKLKALTGDATTAKVAWALLKQIFSPLS